jgi:hypothetical protein
MADSQAAFLRTLHDTQIRRVETLKPVPHGNRMLSFIIE